MSFWEPRSKSEEIQQRTPVWQDNSDIQCEVEGCLAHVFRGSKLCKTHFLERVNREIEEREKEAEQSNKVIEGKNWSKQMAMNQYQSRNRFCSVCGGFGLHHVREKKLKPKKSYSYSECLEVICKDCLRANK